MSEIVGGTWTYSGNPGTDTKDAVRFLIGDTDQRKQLVSDEEILWAISDTGNRYSAAALCCRTIASGGASGSVTVGNMTQRSGMDAAAWEAKAKALEERAVLVGAPPTAYFGGVSEARRDVTDADSDRTAPIFRLGQFDMPGWSTLGQPTGTT